MHRTRQTHGSGDYAISVDGEIIFPELLPPVEVSGLTTKQVEEVLTQQLFEYMYEPKVKVKILERHSHKVLLLGPFQRPGKHELKREEVPLMDLIFFEAGGLTRGIRKDDELTILSLFSALLKNLLNETSIHAGS